MAGCNCGKPSQRPLGSKPRPSGANSNGGKQSFELQYDGKTSQTFSGSMLEAQAQAVRTGASKVVLQ